MHGRSPQQTGISQKWDLDFVRRIRLARYSVHQLILDPSKVSQRRLGAFEVVDRISPTSGHLLHVYVQCLSFLHTTLRSS